MKTTIQMAVAFIFIADSLSVSLPAHPTLRTLHCLRHCQRQGLENGQSSVASKPLGIPPSPSFHALNILSKQLNNCEISSLLVMTINEAKIQYNC